MQRFESKVKFEIWLNEIIKAKQGREVLSYDRSSSAALGTLSFEQNEVGYLPRFLSSNLIWRCHLKLLDVFSS